MRVVAGTTLRRTLAALLLGALAGATASAYLVSHRLQALLIGAETLRRELETCLARVGRLEQSLAGQRAPRVRSVHLRLVGVDAPAQRLAVERQLQPLAQDLVGRRLDRLDPEVVAQLFAGREVEAGGQRYQVAVSQLLLAEQAVIVLVLTPRPAPAPPGPGAGAPAATAGPAGDRGLTGG